MMIIKSNLFFLWYKNDNFYYKKWHLPWKILFWFLLTIVILFSFSMINFSYNHSGNKVFWFNIQKMFYFNNKNPNYPSQSLWYISFVSILQTIKYVSSGTIVGFILALFSAYFSNSKTNNWFISIFYKIIILFFRSFPAIFLIMLFLESFEKLFATTIIIIWFTWIWLSKYFNEIIENVNLSTYYLSLQKGESKFHAFKKEIWPRINTKIINLFFYSFESNIRWSVIASAAGTLGIGFIIYNSYTDVTVGIESIGIPVFILILTILLFEIFIYIFEKYLTINKSKKIDQQIFFKYKLNIKKIILFFVTIILLALSIWNFLDIKWNFAYFDKFGLFIKYTLIDANWNLWFVNSKIDNPFYNLLELIAQTIVTAFLSIIFTIFILFFYNENIQKKSISFIFKFLSILIRSLPLIIYFILFSPVFNTPKLFPIILAISLHNISINVKQLNSSINKINWNIYQNLLMQNWSKFKIYFHYILPSIKKDLLSILAIRIEWIFRDSLILGYLGGSLIGQKLNGYLNLAQPSASLSNAGALIWLIFIVIIFINLINWFIQKQIYKKINCDFLYQKFKYKIVYQTKNTMNN